MGPRKSTTLRSGAPATSGLSAANAASRPAGTRNAARAVEASEVTVAARARRIASGAAASDARGDTLPVVGDATHGGQLRGAHPAEDRERKRRDPRPHRTTAAHDPQRRDPTDRRRDSTDDERGAAGARTHIAALRSATAVATGPRLATCTDGTRMEGNRYRGLALIV